MPNSSKISSVEIFEFCDKEHPRDWKEGRTVVYDLKVKDMSGNVFIVEIQQSAQEYFTERMQYYAYTEVYFQGRKGGTAPYELTPVHLIAIMDFVPKCEWVDSRYLYHFRPLELENHEPLDELLNLTFISLPRFSLDTQPLVDRGDKWCYLLKNLEHMTQEDVRKLGFLNDPIFAKMLNSMALAEMTTADRLEYEERALKRIRDNRAVADFARKEGIQEGIQIGREECLLEKEIDVFRNMQRDGFEQDVIRRALGCDLERFEQIKRAAGPGDLS